MSNQNNNYSHTHNFFKSIISPSGLYVCRLLSWMCCGVLIGRQVYGWEHTSHYHEGPQFNQSAVCARECVWGSECVCPWVCVWVGVCPWVCACGSVCALFVSTAVTLVSLIQFQWFSENLERNLSNESKIGSALTHSHTHTLTHFTLTHALSLQITSRPQENESSDYGLTDGQLIWRISYMHKETVVIEYISLCIHVHRHPSGKATERTGKVDILACFLHAWYACTCI